MVRHKEGGATLTNAILSVLPCVQTILVRSVCPPVTVVRVSLALCYYTGTERVYKKKGLFLL